MTAILSYHPTWPGLASGLALLAVLWWAWVGYLLGARFSQRPPPRVSSRLETAFHPRRLLPCLVIGE